MLAKFVTAVVVVVVLSLVSLALTAFAFWIGLNVIAGFGLSFNEIVGLAVAGNAVSTSITASART